jgi:uncharacterized protein YukE
MVDKFRMDYSGMRDVLGKLDSANVTFSAALNTLSSTLESFDGCWGDDKAGKKFEEGYKGNADEVQGTMRDVSGQLNDSVGNIDSAIGEFQGLDEENAKLYDEQLGDSLEE